MLTESFTMGINVSRKNESAQLFEDSESQGMGFRQYKNILTAVENQKGVLDIDTVKGCTFGMLAHPNGGCYDECYANKIASRYGIDFSVAVSRKMSHKVWRDVFCTVRDFHASWYRIGTAGDPSHDWENTISVCEQLNGTGKIPVIITKHWVKLSDAQIFRLKQVSAVVNTSISALDTDSELTYRIRQISRLKTHGVESVSRVITCCFSDSEWGMNAKVKQNYLLSLTPVIDNPLRATRSHPRVASGDILLTRVDEAVGGGKLISLHDQSVYLGTCKNCPDQCGVKTP